MKISLYDWRCMCGEQNHPEHLHCIACGKQRWSLLGIRRPAALALRDKIVPDYLARRIAC